MPSYRIRGSQCLYRLVPEIDDGTMCRQSSAAPAAIGRFSLWPELSDPGFVTAALGSPEVITDTDKAEYRIVKTMPVYDHKRKPYTTIGAYISSRTLFFGAPSEYARFALESDAELANTKWVRNKKTRTLRSMLEFGKDSRKQNIFYRWVRKAYKEKYGEDADVPELIRRGMSKELADKIAEVRGSIRVKEAHAEEFKAGGFNARPIKYNGRYLLGTLSEHATGMAVDIDDARNPQLTKEEWEFIQNLTGKQVVRSGRWAKEADAEKLYADIQKVSDLFVEKVAAEVKTIEKKREEKLNAELAAAAAAKQKAPPKKETLKDPLQEVLGKHFKSLSRWTKDGFLHLPPELVLELHAHGFVWGATFKTNVDLHHFELDDSKASH